MRWIVAIGSALLIVGTIYFLVFADRTFTSYDGTREGEAVQAAIEHLRANGWTLLRSSSEVQKAVCTGNERYYLVQLRSPDYTPILAADENCKVSNIARKRRGIEL